LSVTSLCAKLDAYGAMWVCSSYSSRLLAIANSYGGGGGE
jgi:hypothetical protein